MRVTAAGWPRRWAARVAESSAAWRSYRTQEAVKGSRSLRQEPVGRLAQRVQAPRVEQAWGRLGRQPFWLQTPGGLAP
jgi:hypothetical protein